jgi:hypothetical protein
MVFYHGTGTSVQLSTITQTGISPMKEIDIANCEDGDDGDRHFNFLGPAWSPFFIARVDPKQTVAPVEVRDSEKALQSTYLFLFWARTSPFGTTNGFM